MADFEISFDLGKLKKILIVTFLIAVFALELNVTFSNPVAFGDEGFHVSTARYVGTEVDYSKYTPLYGSVVNPERFGRPPFWNLIEASFYFLFGFSEAFVKFLVPFISFMTGIVIYVFLKRLYSENVGIMAAAIAVTIPSFVTYSVLFYTTVPYIFLFTIAFLSLLAAIKTGSRKFWLLAGIFSGLSVITNIAGFFMPILTVAMGILHLAKTRNLKGLTEALKTYGIVLLVTVLVMSPWIARNVGLFWIPGCHNPISIIEGVCPENASYQTVTGNQFAGRSSGGGTDDSVLNIGVANYLQFAYGFSSPNSIFNAQQLNSIVNIIGLAFVPFSVLAGLVVLAKRREFSDIMIVVSAIIFVLVFYQIGGLLEGRAEDTARYFLSAVPLIGLAGAAYWSSIRRDGKKFNGPIVLAVLIVVLALSFMNFYSKLVQMDSVKNFVPSFFQACDWVKGNLPKDANLLSLQTYPTRYNCDRGAVWETADKADILLSNDLTLVKSRLEANGIGYIFVQKFSLSNTPFGQAYPVSFVNFLESNNQTFKKLYENGPEYGSQQFTNCASSGGCDLGTMIYQVRN